MQSAIHKSAKAFVQSLKPTDHAKKSVATLDTGVLSDCEIMAVVVATAQQWILENCPTV
jgi:hypothetical protein